MKLHTAYTFFATLALCSCAMIKPIGEKQTLISELPKGEYKKSTLAVGEQKDLAQQRGQKLGFVRNKEVEAYLGKVRDKLVEKSGVIGVPGKVILTASSDFNAYSTADGNIYMSMLAFQRLDSEDEAAALIGHELGHVLLTHHNSSILSKTQNQAQALYEMGMSVKSELNDKPAQGQKDQRDLMMAEIATQVGDKLAMPAWNRTQETAADYLGMDLLIRAGYSPAAMKTMLEKLKAAEVDEKKADEAFQKKLQEVAKRDLSEAAKMFGPTYWQKSPPIILIPERESKPSTNTWSATIEKSQYRN